MKSFLGKIYVQQSDPLVLADIICDASEIIPSKTKEDVYKKEYVPILIDCNSGSSNHSTIIKNT